MTLRARTTKPTSLRTRLRRSLDSEERQQAVVTALFALAIAAIVLILLGAVGLAFYNENIRPLARVGSVEIGPQQLKDRIELEQWRINREASRLTQAKINNEIDQATLTQRQGLLDQRADALLTMGLDGLVDIMYQSQLAAADGLTVDEAEIDARIADEYAGVERRHVFAIIVTPATAADAAPSVAQRHAALEKAVAAMAALESGRPFEDVAREFSTDLSAAHGGDIGFITEIGAPDTNWGERVFDMELGGTTAIVRGQDGAYRIGKVTEITPAAEQPGLREDLRKLVSDASLRDLMRYELAADQLRDKITEEALVQSPEQVRVANIYIDGLFSGDPEDAQGEVNYSEIVYAPGDDLEVAPLLPAEDVAWENARVEAQAAFDELNALTAGEVRAEQFRDKALDVSDSPSGDDGGAVGFVTRSIPPEAVGNALFDTPHTPGDLIGPIRGGAAWYVLLFEERRDSPEQRVQKVQDLLAAPGADFAAIAKEHSEGADADDGGEIGWVTRDQLSPDIVDPVFALAAGQITEPIELVEGHYIFKVEEKGARPLDIDQLQDIGAVAFDNWYAPKREEARTDGIIVIAGEEPEADASLAPGDDGAP
ncbi:MAG: peptidylprolyl isomerase [Candidatus Limnocylindrales bacterium]